jgi:hypothetical protein
MQITVQNNELPVTTGIKTTNKLLLLTPTVLKSKKEELIAVVMQAAETWGFKQQTNINEALELSLGLLSLHLTIKFPLGSAQPEIWAKYLNNHNWATLVQKTIEHLKNHYDKNNEYLYLVPPNDRQYKQPLKNIILEFNKLKGPKKTWNGYTQYTEYVNNYQKEQKTDKLLRDLLNNIPQPVKLIGNEILPTDTFIGITHAEIINTLVFKHCTKTRHNTELNLTHKELELSNSNYFKNKELWIKNTKTEFEKLIVKLKPQSQEQLKNWHTEILENGPPKAKKFSEDPEELPYIEGISSIFNIDHQDFSPDPVNLEDFETD